MTQTTFIVTGASGHLGNTVVRQLIAQGHTVRCLMIERDRPPALQGLHCSVYHGDITNLFSLRNLFAGLKGEDFVVLHLASMISISKKRDRLVERINIKGTDNMLRMAKLYNARRFLYCSSVHAIPELPKGETITEVNHFDPKKVKGLYAKTKAIATAHVLQAGEDGLDTVVVHPSGIIGPNDYLRGHLVQVVLDFVNKKLTTLVKGGYDMVDVRDVATGIISAVESGRKGECYLLTNRFFSVREIIREIADITGRRPINYLLPFFIAKLCAPFVEWISFVRGKIPRFTPYSLYTLQSNSNFSHEKASRELNYQTRPMRKTLEDTVEFLAKQQRFSLPTLLRRKRTQIL